MSAQLYAMLLAFPFLLYAVYEDAKYRAVTPLWLLLLTSIEVVLRLIYARNCNLWSFYFFVLLSLVFAAIYKKWPELLPEADVYILVAVMSALWEPWTLYVFIISLAAIDVLVRTIYAVAGKGVDAFTTMPLPLATEVFPALIMTLVAYVAGAAALFSTIRW